MGQSEQNGSRPDHWSHFPSHLNCYLASFKLYLLLMLMHMSLLLLNYFELSFLTKGQIYGSRLSHILDIPSIPFFPIWCAQYITWYTQYIIFNVTFTFWETWYNNFKCVVVGISHEKRSLMKNFFSRLRVSMLHHRNSSIPEWQICAVQRSFVLELSRFSRFAMELVNRLTKG